MKHYMDIENLREFDIDLGNGMTRRSNCGAFELGDTITITEKIDGSNFSILKNPETEQLECFSRKQQLNSNNTLNGAWNYVQNLDPEKFPTGWIIFGEWTGAKNKIVYNPSAKGEWYVFDIYSTYLEKYLPWHDVETWCHKNGFKYANLLYYGPFISWDHCRTFLNMPHYGDIQEGIVVKNQTKLNDSDNRLPFYLKIVNDSFKESTKIRQPKELNPEIEAAKAQAQAFAKQIVTRNRAEKILLKLRDEGVLPNQISPQDMKTVAKYLPKMMYEDCLKEEPEVVNAMGEYAGKAISSQAMKLAKEILI